jgi:uncharacterized protein YqeY
MSEDAGSDMKARLRANLRSAMKEGKTAEARLIRALIAAIDNAEAPAIPKEHMTPVRHDLPAHSAEVERLLLNSSDVRQVLLREVHERECAAAELKHLQQIDRAEALRAEALLARRYIDDEIGISANEACRRPPCIAPTAIPAFGTASRANTPPLQSPIPAVMSVRLRERATT